jgi:hypothetical protein
MADRRRARAKLKRDEEKLKPVFRPVARPEKNLGRERPVNNQRRKSKMNTIHANHTHSFTNLSVTLAGLVLSLYGVGLVAYTLIGF